MATPEPVERKRGSCLTAFLVLMLIVNPLAGLYYLFASSTLRQSLPTLPGWVIPILAIATIANFVFAIAIWKWRKWGMYGFAGSALVTFVINVISISVLGALVGLIGVALLAFLLRPVWNQME